MTTWILALDIGNTHTVVGVLPAGELEKPFRSWRTVTARDRTSDELGVFIHGFLQSAGMNTEQVVDVIFSSVVPSMNPVVHRMARDFFRCDPLEVEYTMKMPIEIVYPRPYEIGADRLVNAVAAYSRDPGNSIVVDLGTATTFCYQRKKEYLGGSIAPGLRLSLEALTGGRTARLLPVEFKRPPGILGQTTEHAIQSGFFFGWVGLIKEIVGQMKKLFPEETARVVATGGFSSMIAGEVPDLFDEVDPDLTMKGLHVLYRWNRGAGHSRKD